MGEETRPRDRPIPILPLAAIVVVASAIGIALGLIINWFPAQASTQAKKIDNFWDVLIICSVPVFVIVTTIVLFCVHRFRQRPGEELLDGPPIHGNTNLEIVWTAIPAAMLIGLCAYAYVVLHDIEKAPAANAAQKELNVTVYGQQFAWTFEYNENGKQFQTAQLFIPKGRSVKFNVKSKDVLHDFWVPAFRMKIDAVPGITTHYRVTPTKLGEYPIVCAELCGLGHAFMRQTAHVMQPTAWNAWVKKMTSAPAAGGAAGAGGATGTSGAAGATGATGTATASADGQAIFQKGNANGAVACGSCHTLAAAGTQGTVGPDLDKYLKTKDEAFISTSITDPQAYVEKGFPPNVMPPNYKQLLSPAELDAVVKYLYTSTHK